MLRLALVVGMLAMASPVVADASVVVLGIRSIEGDDDVANDLTQQLRQSARSIQGWQVSERAVSMAQMSLAHSCEDLDAGCLADIAKGLGEDRIIYGTMRRTSAQDQYDYAVSLGLFDAERAEIVRNVDRTVPYSDVQTGELRRHADKLISELAALQGGGVIEVQVNAVEAQVALNSEPVGETQGGKLRLENLEPGQYRVEITKEGYAPHVSVVEVGEGATVALAAVLATAGSPEVDFASGADTPPSGGGSNLDWVGWTLVGVSGASLVGSVVSMFVIKSIDEDEEFLAYRDAVARGNDDARNHGVPESQLVRDVCTAADAGYGYEPHFDGNVKDVAAMCDRADTFEVLQWVFLGTAIFTGGVGVAILLSGDDDASASAQPPSLALQPRISPGSAFVGATLRF